MSMAKSAAAVTTSDVVCWVSASHQFFQLWIGGSRRIYSDPRAQPLQSSQSSLWYIVTIVVVVVAIDVVRIIAVVVALNLGTSRW